MLVLSTDLHTQCRTVLLQCHEFANNQILRAFFGIGPLWPFRIGVPEANNLNERVDLCIDYVLKLHLTGGRPVLPVFLATLRDRYQPGDALRDDLQALYEGVQAATTQSEPQLAQSPHRNPALFDLVLKLDFGEQVRVAKQVIQSHQVAAFLVHGGPDYGQQVLVNRLIRLSPGWQTGQRISIDAGSNGVGKSSYSLWRQVASKLGIPTSTPPTEIAEKVCEWWQTQDVIFVFHTVDYMPYDLLSAWIEEFWQPLARMAYQTLHLTQRDTHLLMFLVDYSGCVPDSGLALARGLDHLEYPHVPLHLPPADRFPSDALDFWIDVAAEVLPAGLTAQVLLATSDNGIPQLIYDIICDHCGLSWEGDLARWLI